jgi:hypothetical protein
MVNYGKSNSSDCLETFYQQLGLSGEIVCYYETRGGRTQVLGTFLGYLETSYKLHMISSVEC